MYLLIGSANVNQRSMDGQRDTEIAIGCYETEEEEEEEEDGDSENNKKKMRSHGEICKYRMSLWYEHSGCAEELFLKPESLECVQKLREIGDEMWKIYSNNDEVVDMEGVHLVTYPLKVTEEGGVEEVDHDCEGYFPDTKCPVKGKRTKVLPPIFTT